MGATVSGDAQRGAEDATRRDVDQESALLEQNTIGCSLRKYVGKEPLARMCPAPAGGAGAWGDGGV